MAIDESAYKDAQSQNDISRNVKQYTDLDLDFTKKVVGSDVNKLTDILAIKRSVRNLVLLNVYEKPFHPEIASGVRDMLFENMTPMVAVVLARKIEDVINNFEPRARLVSVRANPDFDRNQYNVSIEFYIVNAPTELVELDVMLERLR
jgi:phage baseplate assembly protein W|tara:strand:+ start:3638 stop:4081 length:444 start_codon:yes stop_codon:yes gene_type:complete